MRSEKFVLVCFHCCFTPCTSLFLFFDVTNFNENVFEEAFLFVRFMKFKGCMEQIDVGVPTV